MSADGPGRILGSLSVPKSDSAIMVMKKSAETANCSNSASRSPSPRFLSTWYRGGDRPLQTWKTFLRNHMGGLRRLICSWFRRLRQQLFAFLVLGHKRRQLLWFAVTRNPTAEWLARQITEAFPWDTAPKYLIRDNDRAFGAAFRARVRAMGIRDRPTSFRSPWQNGLVERLIGSARHECTDHVIVFNEDHLRRILSNYAATIMRCGPTFRLARTHPTHARSSGLETSLRSRSLADYTIDTHESEFSEATGFLRKCARRSPATRRPRSRAQRIFQCVACRAFVDMDAGLRLRPALTSQADARL
jgi:hypothetical protein